MIQRQPISTRTYPLFPYTTPFLSDLRGLGTSRTLVLVNGKRHVTASPGDYLVDVNTIPVDLLERVDIVTGGNSAIYGSDAVAGVVNFITKRDFEGVNLRAQGGLSSRGGPGTPFVRRPYGKNSADGPRQEERRGEKGVVRTCGCR